MEQILRVEDINRHFPAAPFVVSPAKLAGLL